MSVESRNRYHSLALFDIDETIYDQAKCEIPRSVRKAFAQSPELGVGVSFDTANGLPLLHLKYRRRVRPMIKRNSIVSEGVPMAVSRGANIVDTNGRSIYAELMRSAYNEMVLETFPRLCPDIVTVYHLPESDPHRREQMLAICRTPDASQMVRESYSSICTIIDDPSRDYNEIARLVRKLRPVMITTRPTINPRTVDLGDLNFAHHHSGFTDFNAPGVDKVYGAEMVGFITGVPVRLIGEDDVSNIELFYMPGVHGISVGERLRKAFEVAESMPESITFVPDPQTLGEIYPYIAAQLADIYSPQTTSQ